ncbi:lytic transglycosylase domain-containing protein [Alkalibacillus sp. S2W]|uniref:lytic transglycosylase domain-containing protein n=1 Tax=Alkalibacillus sp. S2W TaxID=3386553 RepID=UPI00398D6009
MVDSRMFEAVLGYQRAMQNSPFQTNQQNNQSNQVMNGDSFQQLLMANMMPSFSSGSSSSSGSMADALMPMGGSGSSSSGLGSMANTMMPNAMAGSGLMASMMPGSSSNQGMMTDLFSSQTNQIKQALAQAGEENLSVDTSDVEPSQFDDMIQSVAERFNLNQDLLKSVINAESNFNPEAISDAGAQGLMQLMPQTAEALGVTNPFDPQQNIEGGARYLRDMLNRYDGNLENALAAYNAGPGNVDQYGGVPPFAETQNYVSKILG